MTKKKDNRGWYRESKRHSLAAHGIKTNKKTKTKDFRNQIKYNISDDWGVNIHSAVAAQIMDECKYGRPDGFKEEKNVYNKFDYLTAWSDFLSPSELEKISNEWDKYLPQKFYIARGSDLENIFTLAALSEDRATQLALANEIDFKKLPILTRISLKLKFPVTVSNGPSLGDTTTTTDSSFEVLDNEGKPYHIVREGPGLGEYDDLYPESINGRGNQHSWYWELIDGIKAGASETAAWGHNSTAISLSTPDKKYWRDLNYQYALIVDADLYKEEKIKMLEQEYRHPPNYDDIDRGFTVDK